MNRARQVLLLPGLVLIFLSTCAIAKDPGIQLGKIADDYFTARLDLDPMEGTATTGEAKYEDKLAITIAPSQLKKVNRLAQQTLKYLTRVPEQNLQPADRITYDVLKQQLEDQLEAGRYPTHLMPIDQYGGFPVYLAQLGSGQDIQPLKTVDNYKHYLKRLEKLPAWIDQAIDNMKLGIRQGVVQHKSLIQSGLPSIRALTETDPEKNPFFLAIQQQMPANFSLAEKQQLTEAYKKVITSTLIPSSKKLVEFLEQDYLPHTRTHAGINSLPDGKAWYEYLVRFHTTTSMTPEEIHQLGLSEVSRIHKEMEKIQKVYGFKGSLQEFLRWQNNDAQFKPFTSEKEILDSFVALNKKIIEHLPSLFGRIPKSPLIILPEPPLTRATASDHYNPPAPDGSRPGIYYAVIENPKDYRNTKMTSIFLHEGQPGHHFQIGEQIELPLPRFRKYGWITSFGEGWALYAETLGKEMGLYEDPNQYLGHLKLELVRAVRLVTDTGLHAKNWSREQTIEYMMNTEGSNESDARRATERYMASPGQALAYKIGALKIQQLRQQAKAALGDKFSLRDFHDLVLEDGVLPLSILEAKVNAWIQVQRQAP